MVATSSIPALIKKLEKHVDTDFVVADDMQQPSAISEESSQSSRGSEDLLVPKIVAAGRGGALSLPAIFQKVIELSGKETPNVAYIGTASFDRTDKFKRHIQPFEEIGCKIERIKVSDEKNVTPKEDMRQIIVDWADVILCAAGNTLHALLRWKEVGLDLLIKEAAEKGTVLCGGSAGAGCWFSSLHSDSLRPDNVKSPEKARSELGEDELANWDYVKISGMGYINAMCVPHYDATGSNDVPRSEHAQEVLAADPETTAIGIDNNAALVIEGDMAMVVSGDGEATCHIVVADEETGGTASVPIPQTEEPVPLEELLELPEPCDAPHLENLDEHVDTDFKVADELQLPAPLVSDCASASSKESDESESKIKIVAAGRMKAFHYPAIVEKVLEMSGKEKPNILYIGTASFDRTDKFNLITKLFRERECIIERLNVSEENDVPSQEEMRRLVVDWADVLLCSGGNTLHALLRWKEVGLDLLMKEAAEKGTVLSGGSAGAGCWFSSIHSDSLRPDNVKNAERVKSELGDDDLTDWDYVKISGMGYINAMCVPHYDTSGTNDVSRSEHAQEILAQQMDGTPAIGIDENAAFVVDGDKAMVVSGDGEATCHIVVADEETGGTASVPIPQTEEPLPLDIIFDVPISAV